MTRDDLGALFRVPTEAWTALSKRVASAEVLAPIAGEVARWMPAYPALLEVCRLWRASTFPAVVAAAGGLRDYATQAITEFSEIQQQLPPDGQAPSDTVAVALTAALNGLASRTAQLSGQFDALGGPVAQFYDANQQVDADIDTIRDRLGPEWSSVLPQATMVQSATGTVRGVWSALADDLAALTRDPIEIDAAFVAGLQIEVAIRRWTGLRIEADAFARSAPAQEQYLSGRWLGQEAGR